MKTSVYFIILLTLSSQVFADHKIEKYELELEKLAKQEQEGLTRILKKTFQDRSKILDLYYKELQKYVQKYTKASQIDKANEVDKKKEQVFKEYKDSSERTNKPVEPPFDGFLRTIDLKVKPGFPIVALKDGELCVQKGGTFQNDETWQELPEILKGKPYVFVSGDESNQFRKAVFHHSFTKKGYVYLLTSSANNGNEKLAELSTSIGRKLYLYKFYINTDYGIFTSTRSGRLNIIVMGE
jgi:hypothetical protein